MFIPIYVIETSLQIWHEWSDISGDSSSVLHLKPQQFLGVGAYFSSFIKCSQYV